MDHTKLVSGGVVAMRNGVLYGLIALAALLSVGHHLDHAIRGNHVGWPLTAEVTPFTDRLGGYPLILVGLLLSWSRRVAPGYWALLSGSGALFVGAIHFGAAAIESPADISTPDAPRRIGRFAFAWLVVSGLDSVFRASLHQAAMPTCARVSNCAGLR